VEQLSTFIGPFLGVYNRLVYNQYRQSQKKLAVVFLRFFEVVSVRFFILS